MNNQDMNGQVVVITGGNAGIGKRAALQLAQMGAEVIIICRSKESGEKAREEIIRESRNEHVHLYMGDMSSQSSIHSFTNDIKRDFVHIDVVIHNAANFDLSMKSPTLTEDGIETIFATNHLGPFLLSNLLLDLLEKRQGRIITIGSKGLLAYPKMTIQFDNLHGERNYSPTKAYYQSKLAQLMFTYQGADILKSRGITINAIRVPSVQVDEGRHKDVSFLMKKAYQIKRKFSIPPEKMALTYTYLAASHELAGVSGKYFNELNQIVTSSKNSYDRNVWEELWDTSNQLTGVDKW